jgi:hypothetical protein
MLSLSQNTTIFLKQSHVENEEGILCQFSNLSFGPQTVGEQSERTMSRAVSDLSFMSAGKVYVSSHPDLFEVVFRPGAYCSALIARKVRLPDDPSLLAMSELLTISVVRTSRLAKSWYT